MRTFICTFAFALISQWGFGASAHAQQSVALPAPVSASKLEMEWLELNLKEFFTKMAGPHTVPCTAAQQPVEKNGCVMPANPDNKPNFKSGDKDVGDFIEYLAGLALPLTHQTHYPTSVLIAQALLESGAGKSDGYVHRNSFFGLSCFNPGEVMTYLVDTENGPVEAKGRCSAPRPKNERGYYVVFEHPVESVYAYLYTILQSPNTTYYSKIRGAIQSLVERKKSQNVVMNYQDAVSELTKYNPKPKEYKTLLLKIIHQYSLDRFDHAEPCI